MIIAGKYRKKPVVVDVVRWSGQPEDLEAIIAFAGIRKVTPDVVAKALLIETLEGTMRAELGDYIIRGIRGEIYPCKPGIFEETYERV